MALPLDDVATTIHGLWPIRANCHETKEYGYHWPQYCEATGGNLSDTVE